jgi:hypothetical protein
MPHLGVAKRKRAMSRTYVAIAAAALACTHGALLRYTRCERRRHQRRLTQRRPSLPNTSLLGPKVLAGQTRALDERI